MEAFVKLPYKLYLTSMQKQMAVPPVASAGADRSLELFAVSSASAAELAEISSSCPCASIHNPDTKRT